MTTAPPPPTVQDRGQLETLARRGTASVVGAGVSAVLGIFMVVVVTNGFSATTAGIFFASTSAFLILQAVALLGTDTGLVKVLPAQLASGRAADVRRTVVVSALPVLVLAVLAAAALYVAAPYLSPHLGGEDVAEPMTEMLRALAIVLPVAAMHDLVLAGTRGLESVRPTVVVENIGRLGMQAVAVLLAFLYGADAVWLAIAWSVPYVAGLLASTLWLRRMLAVHAGTGGTRSGWGRLASEFWSYTAPRAAGRVTQTALKRVDIILVAALASPADAALYTAATRFIVLGQLFVQSVQQAMSPQLSSLFTRGETRAASSIFQAATLWSILVAWPLYLVTASWAPVLMSIFGEGYSVAADVTLILSVTMLVATACGPVDSVLLMAGHSWLSLANSTVTLAVNIGLNLVLIPLHGIEGAAVAWSVAIVVRNVLPLTQVGRHLGMWPLTRAAGRVGLMAAGCFGSAGVVVASTALPPVVDAAVFALALLAYAGGTWALRSDLGLHAFRGAVRPRAPRTQEA